MPYLSASQRSEPPGLVLDSVDYREAHLTQPNQALQVQLQARQRMKKRKVSPPKQGAFSANNKLQQVL